MMMLNRYEGAAIIGRCTPFSRAYPGFASFDALLSLLPILLMMLLLMDAASALEKKSQDAAHRQKIFDRLSSVADYTVKIGAARREGGLRYPNWLDEAALGGDYADSLKERVGLSSLYIGFAAPQGGYYLCLYRIAVVGEGKEIQKLYVCGS